MTSFVASDLAIFGGLGVLAIIAAAWPPRASLGLERPVERLAANGLAPAMGLATCPRKCGAISVSAVSALHHSQIRRPAP